MKRNSTLYLSDLDGTLLNENAELSRETVTTLNKLIDEGLMFSVATARTQATVAKMLSEVNLKLPIILMNGVTMYRLDEKRCVDTKFISKKGVEELLRTIKDILRSGFLYSIKNNELFCYYENVNTPNAEKFIRERVEKYGKRFTKVDSFDECIDSGIVYFSIEEKKEKLNDAYEILSKVDDLHVEFYRDIYEKEHYYLEVSSNEASKKNALNSLKRMYDFDFVVSFGDNLNDIPLFEGSDYSLAVANAKDEVKKRADEVIGSNIENGVVRYLSEKWNNR